MTISMFSRLPKDVLVEIITQLKSSSDTTQDLQSCLLVSRYWREVSCPLLYGNVALTRANLSAFCKQLHVGKYAAYIHSITVTVQLDTQLVDVSPLVPLLSQLPNLRSFSLWLGNGYHELFPQSALARLVEALPPSCTSLELDTFGHDTRAEGDVTHLCDSLRRVLPRLQHVRLRLRSCEALFTDPVTPDQPIRFPHLKSFIYACTGPGAKPLPTCRCADYLHPTTHEYQDLLWPVVTSALQRLLETPNALPQSAQVFAFMTTDRNDNDLSLWPAHILANILTQTSLALPYRAIWMESNIRGSCLLRLSDGSEVVSTPRNIEVIAEGQLWREVRGGSRLPAALLKDAQAGRPSFAQGCEKVPLAHMKTVRQWREENPRKRCMMWVNEERLGLTLVDAEVRSGEGWLGLQMVREVTPDGWRRVGMGDVLEKIET